jgi:hypothetical protein
MQMESCQPIKRLKDNNNNNNKKKKKKKKKKRRGEVKWLVFRRVRNSSKSDY